MSDGYTFTGSELFRAGFTRLCSIIPPDGELSPHSAIENDQRGKSPGRLNHAGQWGGYDWLGTESTGEMVAKWDKDGAGFGIVCGVGDTPIIGVDIDVLDKDASRAIRDVVVETLGKAPIRVGRAPKRLLAYQLDLLSEPVTWQKLTFALDGQRHLIEIHGKGRQFVAAGVHPEAERPYRWDTDIVAMGAGGLPTIDHDDIARLIETLTEWVQAQGGEVLAQSNGGGGQGREHIDQTELKAPDLSTLADIVRHLPNGEDDYPTRDDYIRVGCAIKAAAADDPAEGFALWSEWAARWPGGNDPEVVEADWSRMKPPFEVGARWLMEQARTRGGYNDAQTVFTPSPHSTPAKRIDPLAGDNADETEATFWSRYCYVEGIKRFVDLKTGAMLDKENFNDRWMGRIGSSASGMNSPAGYYMQFASRRVVQSVTYCPLGEQFIEDDDAIMLNTWKPGPGHGLKGERWVERTATDEDVAPWLDLVKTLVPDDVERGHLLDWLAFQVQRPGTKCNWHPLIWGEQGIGKDTLLVPVLRALGMGRKGNASTVMAAELVEGWTDWYENKSLVVVEEINNFERRSIAEKLKPMLSNPPYTLRINKKFTLPYDVPNVANFVFLSNHADAMPLESSDRRNFIIHAAVKNGQFRADYFADLYAWFDLGGDMFVTGWLAARDLSGFNHAGEAPKTEAKKNMRLMSLGAVESVIASGIEDEDAVFERDLLTINEIEEYIRGRTGGQLKVTPFKLAKILEDAGAGQVGRIRTEGQRVRVWAVRRVEMYRDVSDSKLASLFEAQRRDVAAEQAGNIFGKKGG